jgi:hypothetical protein
MKVHSRRSWQDLGVLQPDLHSITCCCCSVLMPAAADDEGIMLSVCTVHLVSIL